MALVNQTIPNLINGVSEQPDILRLGSQCEAQKNFASTPSEGLKKRPGTQLLGQLVGNPSIPTAKPFFHKAKRDNNEEYIVWIDNGNLRVWDLNGNEQTVNFPEGKGYLSAPGQPRNYFRAVTVADFTFILNRSVTVQNLSDVKTVRRPDCLIWVKQADYNMNYVVRVNGNKVGESETRTTSGELNTDPKTNLIAKELLINGSPNIQTELPTPEWTTSYGGGALIYLRNADGNDFSATTIDGNSDRNLILFKDAVQTFADLPKKGYQNFYIKVEGDSDVTNDNYYVEFEPTNSGEPWDGIWKETLKRGEPYKLDPTTMPWGLVREANGTFTFRTIDWKERKVGDLDTTPFPSYVGQKLNDIFFHRNRLGLLAGENIVMSKAGEFFNFFRDTATQVLDSDPIDVAVTSARVSVLKHAVSFDRTVVFLSDDAQFMLGETQVLTPETIAVNETTAFEADPDVPPVRIGKFLYFGSQNTTGVAIREYFVDETSETEDATDITSHVPTYIPPSISGITAAPNTDAIVVLSEGEPNSLFVYRFYWSGQEKLQSSWSKYTLDYCERILGVEFFGSKLYVFTQLGNRMWMEMIDFSNSITTGDLNFLVCLDRLTSSSQLSVTYDSNNDETIIDTSNFDVYEGTAPISILDDKGVALEGTRNDFQDIRVPGNVPDFWIGRRFSSEYVFSTIYPKARNQNGQVSMGIGRLQLRYMTLDLADTVEITVQVTPEGRPTYEKKFEAQLLANDAPAAREERFRFPIQSKNLDTEIKIVNDSPYPCAVNAAEWEGLYTVRSRKLGG